MDAETPFAGPTRPLPRLEETWLPGILFAVGAAFVTVVVGAQCGPLSGIYFFMLSAAITYGCLIGYANHSESASRSWLFLPWILCIIAGVSELNQFPRFFSFFGPLRIPVAALTAVAPWTSLWAVHVKGIRGAFLTAMAVIGDVFLLITVLAYAPAIPFLFNDYSLFSAGLILGVQMRWLTAGRVEFMTSPPIRRFIPRQFSILGIIALTTAVAVCLGITIMAGWPVGAELPLLYGIVTALVAAAITLVRNPALPDGPGIVRLGPPPAPWVRCEGCGHVTRHDHAQCPRCGNAYPVEPPSAELPADISPVESSPVAPSPDASNPIEPEATGHDWTV